MRLVLHRAAVAVVAHLPLRVRMRLYYRGRLRQVLGVLSHDEVVVSSAGPPGHRFRMRLRTDRDLHLAIGIHEPAVVRFLQQLIGHGDVAIDVGAHLGHHTLLLSQLVGAHGRVLAIEPNPAVFGDLVANLELNGVANVDALNLAAGEAPGELRLALHAADPQSPLSSAAGRLPPGEAEVMVPVQALDSLVEDRLGGRAPKLVKVDVEGMEAEVMRGAAGLLADPAVTFILEVNDREGEGARRLIKWLAGLGLCIEEVGRRGTDAFVAVRHQPS